MNTTLLSTISVMNFNNINNVRSAAKKAYGPSSDFLFSNFPVSKSFSDYIDSAAEKKVNDFIERYKDSSSTLSEVSRDLKQLFISTYENKKVRVSSDTLEAVAKQDAMVKEYNFTVEQLATVQQDTSNAVERDGTSLTDFGVTEISINQAGETFDITMNTEGAADNQTVLKQVSSAINKSQANVSAKVLTDDSGKARLSLESHETGIDQAFKVTGDLASFIDIKSISSAQNAKYSMNGSSLENSSNTIALDNNQLEVTFKEETNGTETIGVELNTEAVESKLSNLVKQLDNVGNFLINYSTDSPMLAKYNRRFQGLIHEFERDLEMVGIEKNNDDTLSFSKDHFQQKFDESGTSIIKNLDRANGFIKELNRFSDNLQAQNIQTLSPASSSNNLPTFMQDDFISYLSMSRSFNINAFYPTGGILDFML